MCLPVSAALSSSEVSGAAFKLYACYCAHREGFEASVKNEQIHAETGLGYAYISTLKFELLEAGWIGLSKTTAKGIVPLKGFEGAADHIRTERKLSKIERTSDKKVSNTERTEGDISNIETPAQPPEKLSNIERILSDEVSKNERNPAPSFENQKEISGTPVAPYSDIRTSTDTPQPTVEGADAPPPARPSRKVVPHPSAKTETDHQRLMRELAKRLGGIADGAKQGKWAKWLLDHDYTVTECIECLDDLTAQDWRDTRVDWLEVSKQIGAWKARKENGSSKEITPAARNGVVRGGFDRTTVTARTQRQNDNASALFRGAADRLAAAGGVRGGGEPVDS